MKVLKLRKPNLNRKTALITGIILIVVLLGFAAARRGGNETPEARETEAKSVEVSRVSDIVPTLSIQTIGEVESVEEVTVRTRSSGLVTAMRVEVGDRVERGQLIATLEAGTEAASVAQAQAGVQAAEAALDKFRAGATPEERRLAALEVQGAEDALEAARTSARDAIQSAYSAADIAIRTQIDPIFLHPRTNPELRFSVSSFRYGNLKGDLQGQRRDAEQALNELRAFLMTISDGADTEDIEEAERLYNVFIELADLAGLAVNSTPLDDPNLPVWRTNIASARTTLNASISGLRGARTVIENAERGIESAEERREIVEEGARSEDIRAAEASVASARAGLQFASVNLGKTSVVSPISGTVNETFIERGDAAGMFAEVATIAQNEALEITAYLSPEEARIVSVGSSVRVGEASRGEVSRIAGAIGSTGKIEINVLVTEKSDELLNGDVVDLSFETTEALEETADILIPLSALKTSFQGEYVLTIEDSVATSILVTSGEVRGDYVVIEEGLSGDEEIILDARGIEEGEEVTHQ